MRAAQTSILLGVAVLSSAAVADEVPWKERHELVVTPWPGLPDDPERYAKAEVMWMNATSLENCNSLGCDLRVFPFDEVCENQVCEDLCPATSPFYAQPDPTNGCSGIRSLPPSWAHHFMCWAAAPAAASSTCAPGR